MDGTERGYVSLDDLTERDLANETRNCFCSSPAPVLIDEVQYAPELFPYIKLAVDREHQAGAFWLTGSQIFKLMRGMQESLAGRVAVLSMTTLSQAEADGAQTEPFLVELEALKRRVPDVCRQIRTKIFDASIVAQCCYRQRHRPATANIFTAAI